MAAQAAPDPLRLRPHGLGFDELKRLSEYLDRVSTDADASLDYFRDPVSGGYDHRVDPATGPEKDDYSKASTATCLAYLRAVAGLTGSKWDDKRIALRKRMVSGNWNSAKLGEDNLFTVSFLLDAIDALTTEAEPLEDDEEQIVESKLNILRVQIEEQKGGLALKGEGLPEFAPTAFLVHKTVRALQQWDAFGHDLRELVRDWTWQHLYEESMLIASGSPDADFLELAYSVLSASLVSPLDTMTPRQRRLLQHGLEQFFGGQRADGTWPRSRPLFLYPGLGFAYCYDYELLVHLLSDRQLARFVIPHLGELRLTAWALDSRQVPLERTDLPKEGQKRAFGWSSEHHGRDFQAESWPTAAVFHFCFELQRLVADAIRRDMFEYVDITYVEPKLKTPEAREFDELLDSWIDYGGEEPASFKERFGACFLDPLTTERDNVRDGRSFGKKTQVSAIMYGPPGTAKTDTAERIAQALGWPLLALDPSHLTRRGLDNVHAEADALFGRLRLCDQIVVLLDEFDELVREREAAGELTSRFLTTAMLPKIAALSARRRIVYLVATNHLEQFDAAISRPGRFDVIVPVMPPTADAKITQWPPLGQAVQRLGEQAPLEDLGADPPTVMTVLGDLTYAEAEDLAGRVNGENDETVLRDRFVTAAEGATLYQPVLEVGPLREVVGRPGDPSGESQPTPPERWKARIESQRTKIRGLNL